MTESGGIAPPTWFLLAALAVGLYRCAMAILLSAFHALPSLQRRRLLEEDRPLSRGAQASHSE